LMMSMQERIAASPEVHYVQAAKRRQRRGGQGWLRRAGCCGDTHPGMLIF
jgi:hypothetical protein